MIICFDIVGKEIILLLYFIYSGEYPAECLIVNRAVFLCLLGDSNILLKCMGEKFCIRSSHSKKKITNLTQVWRQKVLPNMFKCFDNFSGRKNKMSAFTTLLPYWFLASFAHFRMVNNDFTTRLHWWQHSKILESPNKHNVMTSFGMRLIVFM